MRHTHVGWISFGVRQSYAVVPSIIFDMSQQPYSSLQWGQNQRHGVSNHQPHDCLLKRLFRRRSKKDQSSASLAFVRGIRRWPVNYTHKGPVTRKMYPFYDVIMVIMTIRWLHLATETHWLPLPKSGLTISHVVALHVGAGLLTIPVSLINITILANQVLNTRFIITVKLWF